MENLKDNIDDSESVASDESEEIIEVDEDEYDRRRATILNDMKELEFLFSKLKEALINEKQMLIDQKLKEIEEETAEEFTIPLQKLKQNMECKINLATQLKDYKCKNIEHIYQYEELSIKKSLEYDKQSLFDKYVTKLENEIKELEEKRRQFLLDCSLYQLNMNGSLQNEQENTNLEIDLANPHDISDSLTNSSISPNTVISLESLENPSDQQEIKKSKKSKKSPKSSTSNLNQNAHQNNNNGVHNNNISTILFGSPYIVYSLQDYDILEDWSIIKMHSNLNKVAT